jgi:hypothetical protein
MCDNRQKIRLGSHDATSTGAFFEVSSRFLTHLFYQVLRGANRERKGKSKQLAKTADAAFSSTKLKNASSLIRMPKENLQATIG